jgi:esterase/lipase
MKKFLVTFCDVFEAKSEEEAYQDLLQFLQNCVKFEDVTPFEFTEQKKEK